MIARGYQVSALEAALAESLAALDALTGPIERAALDDPYAPREDGVGAEAFVSDPYPGEDDAEEVL